MIFYVMFGSKRRRILAIELPIKSPAVREHQNDAGLHHSNAPQHDFLAVTPHVQYVRPSHPPPNPSDDNDNDSSDAANLED